MGIFPIREIQVRGFSRWQRMRRIWNSSLPHKLIKDTSTHGKILTEHLLNTSRGPQAPVNKRTRKIPIKPGKMRK